MPAWRDSYKPARFFTMDARIMFFILPTLLHIRWYTMVPTAVVAVTLWYVEKHLEMHISSALRAARSYLVGHKRPNVSLMKVRYRVDYDRTD